MKINGIIHNCEFFPSKKTGRFINNLSNMDCNCFHIILRPLDKSIDKIEYHIDFFSKKHFFFQPYKVNITNDDSCWYDVILDNNILIGIYDEPVGVQLEFDNTNCLDAIKISDEFLFKIEEITNIEGEILVVINENIVKIPI